MWGTSDFRFVGVVSTKCVLTYCDKEMKRPMAKFSIATKVKFSQQESCRFPIVCFDDVALKASHFCKVGARVAVSGTIVSQDETDRRTGEDYVRTFFYAFEILCIARSKQKSLSAYERRFSELTALMPTDPYNRKAKR